MSCSYLLTQFLSLTVMGHGGRFLSSIPNVCRYKVSFFPKQFFKMNLGINWHKEITNNGKSITISYKIYANPCSYPQRRRGCSPLTAERQCQQWPGRCWVTVISSRALSVLLQSLCIHTAGKHNNNRNHLKITKKPGPNVCFGTYLTKFHEKDNLKINCIIWESQMSMNCLF